MIDLLNYLTRFDDLDNVETDSAYLRTRVPAVAPLAYLAVVFKPANVADLSELTAELALPSEVVEFLARWNGTILFLDNLAVYGCLPRAHPPLNRHDPLDYLPFDLRGMNAENRRPLEKRNLVCVGSYGYDRSLVCVERSTGEVMCTFGDNDDFDRYRARWKSFSDWLSTEVPRVGGYFDPRGKRLVPEEWTLPGVAATH